MPQFIVGLQALARKFDRLSAEEHVVVADTMGAASHILHRRVCAVFGDKTKLAALSPFTQDERESLGYTRDEPLLRDGTLLRDHVEREHVDLVAGVGSAEPVQLYSELGFVNARTGTSVPPRPAFKIGLDDAKEEILDAFGDALAFIFEERVRKAIKGP